MKNHILPKRRIGIHSGFTLVELLVVIVIIAVLVTLAFMGTRRMREMADKANSTRNLSQLQIANIAYAADHSGNCVPLKLQAGSGPVTSRWFLDLEFLANLTGKTTEQLEKNPNTAIPLQMLDPKVVRAKKPLHDRVYTSYGMNETGLMGTTESSPRSHNMGQISNPSRSMIFATATDYRIAYGSRFKWDFENPKDEKTGAGEIAYRHGDKVLAVYFDGHVGEMSKADFEAIDGKGGRTNVFWNPKAN